VSGIVSFPNLPGNQSVPEAADFVLIEVPDGVAQRLRRRIGAGDQAVSGKLIEDLLAVRVQRESTFTLY